jgi:hypothetical protein
MTHYQKICIFSILIFCSDAGLFGQVFRDQAGAAANFLAHPGHQQNVSDRRTMGK